MMGGTERERVKAICKGVRGGGGALKWFVKNVVTAATKQFNRLTFSNLSSGLSGP